MTEKELALAVQKNTKPTYRAGRENDKLVNDVANKGLKKGQVAIRRRNGEFHGIAVEVLEDIKPLLTDVRVAKAIHFLCENDMDSALLVLNLKQEVQEAQQPGIVYEVLRMWLQKNDFTVPQEYISKARKITCSKIKKWVLRSRHQPMEVPLKIKSIGKAKDGHSVVPEEWLERVFKNARDLHSEMDKLDWRKGKAPVTFCCSYSMKIREDYKWQTLNRFLFDFDAQLAVEILFIDERLQTQVYSFVQREDYHAWLETKRDADYLPAVAYNAQKIVIACDKKNICRASNTYERRENVGLLVSMLQKSIRSGRKTANLMAEVVHKLALSPSYSLPEYQFARVSGSRQLVWRLFISIIEDVMPYAPGSDYFSLLDLVSLALLTHFDADIQFAPHVVAKILHTALLVLDKDEQSWPWHNGKEKNVVVAQRSFGDNNEENSMLLALKTMPMMEGDRKLLRKSIDLLPQQPQLPLATKTTTELRSHSCPHTEKDTKRRSYDMHCVPGIVLQLQANLPFIPYDLKNHSTKGLVNFIWNYSSSKNIRHNVKIHLNDEEQHIMDALQATQNFLLNPPQYQFAFCPSQSTESEGRSPSLREKRIAFQLIFGQKVVLESTGKQKSAEIVVAGCTRFPCKVKRKNKYLDGKERFEAELRYTKHMAQNREITIPSAPPGFKWIWGEKKKIHIRVELQHSDGENYQNNILFFAENIPLTPFDATPVLVSLSNLSEKTLPEDILQLVQQSLYTAKSDFALNYRLRAMHAARKQAQNFCIYHWTHEALDSPLPSIVWRNILVKISNNLNNEVLVGPIDRNGKRLHEAISYLYEGTALRILNLLSCLYPQCITLRGKYKFSLDRNTSAFLHMLSCLQILAFRNPRDSTHDLSQVPQIKTSLWDHQKSASEEIVYGLTKMGKKGYGDASNVGAGKTLTALTVLAKILQHNIENKNNSHCGFLVLLPTEKLYKTWQDEIDKHTQGFHQIMQSADGKLSAKIQKNSIVITTLGRMRDHPVYNLWQLVVIDECLSVQNKNALQTEEAWRQVISAQYGVIMMSATFFRSRFDKLFYMLKMLRSGLPEQKAYLDTILSESIICHIPQQSKKWITTICKFPLSPQMRKQYDDIESQGQSSQQIYINLSNYLHNNFDYGACFSSIINELKPCERALIYAKSKQEADEIAHNIATVSRYPDTSGKHTVVSYAEGTYGLNDLILYNTIVTRPPEPDKLPQMKGRLDRPGQKDNVLHIKYLLAENTIDEAWLFRLEMANSFYKDHILPLATFYDLAIGRINRSEATSSNHLRQT